MCKVWIKRGIRLLVSLLAVFGVALLTYMVITNRCDGVLRSGLIIGTGVAVLFLLGDALDRVIDRWIDWIK